MFKSIFLTVLLSLVLTTNFGQNLIKKYHASKMLVVHNTDGSSKGWLACDFNVELVSDAKELKNISLTIGSKNLKVIIRKDAKDKFNYQSYKKDEVMEYRYYDGFDDLTGEEVKMLIGYYVTNNQSKPVSITLNFMLSSNYITLD